MTPRERASALWLAVRPASAWGYLALATAALVVVAVLWGAVAGWTDAYRSRRYEREAKEERALRATAEAERDRWVETAVESEARAAAYWETLERMRRVDLARADAAITAADSQSEAIANETKAELDAADSAALTPAERRARIRAILERRRAHGR